MPSPTQRRKTTTNRQEEYAESTFFSPSVHSEKAGKTENTFFQFKKGNYQQGTPFFTPVQKNEKADAKSVQTKHDANNSACKCPTCSNNKIQLKATTSSNFAQQPQQPAPPVSQQHSGQTTMPIQRGVWGWIKKKASSAVGWVKDKVSGAAGWVKDKASSAIGWIKDKASSVGSWIKNGVGNLISTIRKKGSQAFQWLGGKVKSTWNWLKSKGSAALSWLKKGGQWLWNGLKKAGAFAKKIAGKVWNGIKWVGSQLWSKAKGIFYRVINVFTQLPARLKRLGLHIWEGVKSLKPWSLSWWKSLGNLSTWKNIGSWFGKLVIYGLETVGVGEIYETIADIIKFNTRSLTGEEIAVAREVYGNAINYNLVRVDDHAFLGPSWTKRDYTSFHTINGWGGRSSDVLIHELGHVWQYEQIGAMYMPQALHDQNTMPDAYDYGGVPMLEANKAKGIWAFGREQQAQILQDYYRLKHGMRPEQGSATTADLPLYEHYVNQVRR